MLGVVALVLAIVLAGGQVVLDGDRSVGSQPTGSLAFEQPPPVKPDDRVNADDRAALEDCMAAAGFVVHPARTGSNGAYSWERSSYFTWDTSAGPVNAAAAAQCEARFAPAREMTEGELREIYHRWVLERACLISLGFRPVEPPMFEEFREDWTTGPWMPIDGIQFGRITREAKDRCGLEMVD